MLKSLDRLPSILCVARIAEPSNSCQAGGITTSACGACEGVAPTGGGGEAAWQSGQYRVASNCVSASQRTRLSRESGPLKSDSHRGKGAPNGSSCMRRTACITQCGASYPAAQGWTDVCKICRSRSLCPDYRAARALDDALCRVTQHSKHTAGIRCAGTRLAGRIPCCQEATQPGMLCTCMLQHSPRQH